MQLTLLMVQSSVVLLQRSVRGQLLRSAARFALSHINASLYSSVIGSFKRVTTSLNPGVTNEGIYSNAEESAVDADTLGRGNVSAMAGDLESTGICIPRVACRTLDVLSRSSMVAGLAENCNSPILPSECSDSKRDSLAVEAMDTITVKASESSEQMNETPRSGNASSVKAADDFFARSTLDLASEAQQLLLEARRARVKFQETRQHTPGLSNTPTTRPIGKKQESPLFGNCFDDGELPSPIKTEEDWDWAKSWK